MMSILPRVVAFGREVARRVEGGKAASGPPRRPRSGHSARRKASSEMGSVENGAAWLSGKSSAVDDAWSRADLGGQHGLGLVVGSTRETVEKSLLTGWRVQMPWCARGSWRRVVTALAWKWCPCAESFQEEAISRYVALYGW